MDATRWQKLSAEFDACIGADAAGRAQRLQALRLQDPACAEQLEAMLAAADQASPLDASARVLVQPHAEDDPAPAMPAQLGGWTLDRELGRGGMGVVYAAHRDAGDTMQRAAIKHLHSRWGGSAQVQRFMDERRILAQLSHPNIPRLIDHGHDADGRPWFAQDDVDGQPITAWADARRLTLAARLDMLRKVCAAVQHAHAHFVVHRDLKPANILVDADGEPHVLDFGVAKRTDAGEGMTRTGLYAGFTPEYAAPEQISGGAISAATDVHALGVILYELLTGQLPFRFDAENLQQAAAAITTRTAAPMERAVTEGEAADVAQRMALRQTSAEGFRRFVRGDLWKIVQTALAKEPERRYASVQALADDLKRFQQGRPVSVAGDTPGYRLRKFVARNRWGVAMATLALLAIAGGVAGTAWQLRQTRIQRDIAVDEAQRGKAVREYLMMLFRHNGAADAKVADVLRHGAGNVMASYRDDPRTGLEVLNALGDLYAALGDHNAAAPLFERVIAAPQSARWPEQRARAQAALAEVEFARGNKARATQLLADAQAFWTRDPAPHRLALNASRVVQAQLEREAGDPRRALATLRQALAERQSLLGGRADRESLHIAASIALPLLQTGDFAQARDVSERAWADARRAGLQDTPNGLANLNNITAAKMRMGEYAGAADSARQVYEARTRLYPGTADTAATGVNYGVLLTRSGRAAEAVPVLQTTYAAAVAGSGRLSTVALFARSALLDALLQAPSPPLDLPTQLDGLFADLRAANAPPPLWANAQRLRGMLRLQQGQPAAALAALREAERQALALGKSQEVLLQAIRQQIARVQGAAAGR